MGLSNLALSYVNKQKLKLLATDSSEQIVTEESGAYSVSAIKCSVYIGYASPHTLGVLSSERHLLAVQRGALSVTVSHPVGNPRHLSLPTRR